MYSNGCLLWSTEYIPCKLLHGNASLNTVELTIVFRREAERVLRLFPFAVNLSHKLFFIYELIPALFRFHASLLFP